MEIQDVLFIISWLIAVAVPAAVAVYKSIKAGQYKEAGEKLMDTIEMGDSKKTKDLVSNLVPKNIREAIVEPYVEKKGYRKSLAKKEAAPQ